MSVFKASFIEFVIVEGSKPVPIELAGKLNFSVLRVTDFQLITGSTLIPSL